ncbi:MAG: hypothetical protein GF344_14910 [Chitinivibrionales bacterium]|nr:hypothetical protein [Chitinivibrionales bacterium]MBD3357998.1 hypothetical protein [Chitinivibrionales bacterium]
MIIGRRSLWGALSMELDTGGVSLSRSSIALGYSILPDGCSTASKSLDEAGRLK